MLIRKSYLVHCISHSNTKQMIWHSLVLLSVRTWYTEMLTHCAGCLTWVQKSIHLSACFRHWKSAITGYNGWPAGRSINTSQSETEITITTKTLLVFLVNRFFVVNQTLLAICRWLPQCSRLVGRSTIGQLLQRLLTISRVEYLDFTANNPTTEMYSWNFSS